ncbi:MAG TPA: hypothetical protein VH816_08075 [Gaiellaceae bacterium]|jgi:hypothetical protein
MSTFRRTLALLGPAPIGLPILCAIACATALATYAVADRVYAGSARSVPAHARSNRPAPEAPPSASQFALLLVTLGNLYGSEHGRSARLTGADCVQASAGHYMCSYAVVRPGRPDECHIVQTEWTPGAASAFRVTLGGRVASCHTLREALASLK